MLHEHDSDDVNPHNETLTLRYKTEVVSSFHQQISFGACYNWEGQVSLGDIKMRRCSLSVYLLVVATFLVLVNIEEV